jgi:hypothetical protein
MEMCVQLKICEGCGCLWFRAEQQHNVYCRACEAKLREFPTPESRKRRGRPPCKPASPVFEVSEAMTGTMGGAE